MIFYPHSYEDSECGSYAGGKLPNGKKCPHTSIHIAVQVGVYVLIAGSLTLFNPATLEYSYSKAPRNMRSMVNAFQTSMGAVASAISMAFVGLSDDPLLVWNYGTMAVISFVAGCLFYWKHRGLDKEEDSLNMLAPGRFGPIGQEAFSREVDVERKEIAQDSPLERVEQIIEKS